MGAAVCFGVVCGRAHRVAEVKHSLTLDSDVGIAKHNFRSR